MRNWIRNNKSLAVLIGMFSILGILILVSKVFPEKNEVL